MIAKKIKLLSSFHFFLLLQENYFWTVALQPLADLTGLKEHEVSACIFSPSAFFFFPWSALLLS